MKLRPASLRWQFVIAFFFVSAAPVLIASYIAAWAISNAFERNVDQWLHTVAQYIQRQVYDQQEEAEKSAKVIATGLASRYPTTGEANEILQPFADLLAVSGYDLIGVYDEFGEPKYRFGSIQLLPNTKAPVGKSILVVQKSQGTGLAISATWPLKLGESNYFLMVANGLDTSFFGASSLIDALEIKLFKRKPDGTWHAENSFSLPPEVPVALAEKNEVVTAVVKPDDEIAAAFVGLRDGQGKLVAIIACRLSDTSSAVFEGYSRWHFFAMLAGIAGLLSMLVGYVVASRISRPARLLTQGLRAVAAGDFRTRVPERGSLELRGLAGGFNMMAAQLQRLREMETKMRRQEQFASLGQAAAVIAHEIRNPLGIIKTSSQLIRRKSELEPESDRLVSFVLDEVDRIERLVQDILDYVRPKDTQRKRINLSELIDRLVTMSAPVLRKQCVGYEVTGNKDPVWVLADPDQLYQAFLNLVLNATDAMPEGGTLKLQMDRAGDQVTVLVRDTGAGVNEEVAAKIFEPFVTTKAKGTGLGLAKTRAIIEEHGGDITFESKPGEGATFIVKLPLAKAEIAK